MESRRAGPDLLFLDRIVKRSGNFSGSGEIFLKKPERSQGFNSYRCGSTKYDNSPNRYYIITLVRRGSKGGQALSPPHLTYPVISFPDKRNSTEFFFKKNLLFSFACRISFLTQL
jgi:hypothetical protein